MIVNVVVPLALNDAFSYESNVDLSIGDLVYVPFANKILIGLVIEINVEQREDIVLKKVKQKIENIKFKQELIDFIIWT